MLRALRPTTADIRGPVRNCVRSGGGWPPGLLGRLTPALSDLPSCRHHPWTFPYTLGILLGVPPTPEYGNCDRFPFQVSVADSGYIDMICEFICAPDHLYLRAYCVISLRCFSLQSR